MITAQEILVDNASYPTAKIARNSHDFRPLGLGYANLGAVLMASGLPYDSDAGRDVAAAITAVMHGEAYLQSSRMAEEMGPFAGYAVNRDPFLGVISMHRQSLENINPRNVPPSLWDAAKQTWDDCLASGMKHGYRNAQVTVLAPTGTIGFMMDCDTTGVEPDLALVKYKKLVGGGLIKIVNNVVPTALLKLGYSEEQAAEIVNYIDQHGTIEGAPHLEPEHLAGFRLLAEARERQALHPLHGPRAHDGGRAAVPLRRYFEDRQHAGRSDGRGRCQCLHRGVAPGPEGHRHLPRRVEAHPTAQHEKGRIQDPGFRIQENRSQESGFRSQEQDSGFEGLLRISGFTIVNPQPPIPSPQPLVPSP